MKIEANAKINLSLEVLGIRPDGYHELRSVVAPIALTDTLELTDAADITSDTGFADDLTVKAARVLARHCGVKRGVSIRIEKRIPVGAGLGGGSADAAAVLRGLNMLWGLGLPLDALVALGAEVGSDVPALVLGQETRQPVLMEGRGERVALLDKNAAFAALPLVLVNPNVFVSTKKVFDNCLFRVTNDPKIVYNIQQSWKLGQFEALREACQNDLEKNAMSLEPDIRKACEALEAAGAPKVHMTGSGATVWALAEDSAVAQRWAADLAQAGFWVCATNTIVR